MVRVGIVYISGSVWRMVKTKKVEIQNSRVRVIVRRRMM